MRVRLWSVRSGIGRSRWRGRLWLASSCGGRTTPTRCVAATSLSLSLLSLCGCAVSTARRGSGGGMVGSAAYSAASAIVVVMAKGKGRGGRGGPSGANKVSSFLLPSGTNSLGNGYSMIEFSAGSLD